MEESFDKLLSLCIASLSKVNRLNFKTYILDSLFSLKEAHLDKPILRFAVTFWNLEFHVFRFAIL